MASPFATSVLRHSTRVNNHSFSSEIPKRLFSSLVSWSKNDKVGTITLKSSKTFNALTLEMGKDFEALIGKIEKELHNESNVQAIVLCGEGDKAFSAGGNLEWLHSLADNSVHQNVDTMVQFYSSFICMRQKLPVPVIAALQGPAMGAGACLALSCDLRVAASGGTPVLGFPFTKLGIPSGLGGMYMLQQAGIPSVVATEILLLGKTLMGEDAQELGLVNRLVSADQVKEEAHALAEQVAKMHPVAVRSMIRSFRQGKDNGLMDALYR